MVSLSYNIGTAAFARSSVARLHNAARYPEAGQAFALWNKAGGRLMPGLVARRAAEAALYLSGCAVENAPNADGEKPISQSRTLNGQAIAGAGVAASVGSGVLKDAVVRDAGGFWVDWQETVTSLIPYFETAKYALLALVLIGIGMTLYARWHDRHVGRA